MTKSIHFNIVTMLVIALNYFPGTPYSIRDHRYERADIRLQKKQIYSHMLVIGNSITDHPVNSYWWGNWGMAASTSENDFVHQLAARLREQNRELRFSTLRAGKWERDHQHFELSLFDSAFARTTDLVIIRLGENVQQLEDYEQSYSRLIEHIRQKLPMATIVATGSFWTHAAKDKAMSQAADKLHILFIPLSDLDTRGNKSQLGAIVKGEDGKEHLIDHKGVASHPSDEGMRRIAERIFGALP